MCRTMRALPWDVMFGPFGAIGTRYPQSTRPHKSSMSKDGRSALAVNTAAQAKSLNGEAACGNQLVRAFNEVRAELVSTLYFLLGNHDDAQDAAQDAFLKCWRSQDSLVGVDNLRSWIFRVGLNAAKDLQRSAWRRRA